MIGIEVLRVLVRWLFIAIFAALVLFETGCACIMKKEGRPVLFESDPPGATVRIKGAIIGKTPCTVNMKGVPVVEFQLAGYQPRFVNPVLEDMWRFEPYFWGNVVFLPVFLIGMPIGMAVDAANGHADIMQSSIRASLYPNGSSAPLSPAGFGTPSPTTYSPQVVSVTPSPVAAPVRNEVADRLKTLKDLKDQGVLTDSEYEIKKEELIKQL